MQRIQMLSRSQRLLLFVLIFGGGLFLIIAFAAFLIFQALSPDADETSRAIQSEPVLIPLTADDTRNAVLINVREYALFEDEEAHPSSLALADDGTLYVGSYATGTIWRIPPGGNAAPDGTVIDGIIEEIPGTRDQIGSVTGLALGPDGTLYVADRIDPNPRAAGGTIWRIVDDEITPVGNVDSASGLIAPGHIATDPAGNLYVIDRGDGQLGRFAPDGETDRIWTIPDEVADNDAMIPTGIAYDPSTDSLIVTDSELSVVFRVSLDGTNTEELYRYTGPADDAPQFNGVDVSADGTIYLAALSNRRVAMLLDGTLYYLAENFRQVSDVAVSADGRTIYATNLDGRSLVLPGVQPRRPFSVDAISLDVADD